MRWVAVPCRVVGFVLLCSLLGIGLAPWAAAFVDRGPIGNARFSVFPLVLALFDPFVWTCAVNSLIVAGLVTAGSMLIGLAIGTAGANPRFPGRSALWALAMLPLAAEPLLLAPSIGMILNRPESWDWLAARSLMNDPLDDLVRWAALGWIGLACGTPIVALATASAMRKVDPSWLDAARLTGAGRGRIWREIVWPILKPEVAVAGSAVFVLSLVEPAGPLILGLNRTLVVQILDSAIRLDQPTRAACLAVLAVTLVTLARTLIGWWGGSSLLGHESRSVSFDESADFRTATIRRLILLGWSAFAAGPILYLMIRSFHVLNVSGNPLSATAGWAAIRDPELLGWLANSAVAAGFAVLLDVMILSVWIGRSSSDRGLRFASNFLGGIPSLALGLGALATPWLLEISADLVSGPVGEALRLVARELNPARFPGFSLILVIAAVKWPVLFRVAEMAKGQSRKILIDASRLMGASDRRALRCDQPGWLGFVPWNALPLVFAMGATNLAPGLLLSPFSERRTIAPSIIQAIVREGSIGPRIAVAILLVLMIKVVAFAVASRSRAGSLGEWYRG